MTGCCGWWSRLHLSFSLRSFYPEPQVTLCTTGGQGRAAVGGVSRSLGWWWEPLTLLSRPCSCLQEANDGLLWVVEQIPGLVVAADMTPTLCMGYFPSMNIPFFPEVRGKAFFPCADSTGLAPLKLAPSPPAASPPTSCTFH